MRKLRGLLLLVLAIGAVLPSGAMAADITIGPNLSGTYTGSSCGTPCTLTNATLTQSGAQLTSPVSGAVVRWRVIAGTTAGNYRLRAVTPLGGGSFLFTGGSTEVASVPTAGVQTFTTTMPIAAGQEIGLDMSSTASVGLSSGTGTFRQWEPVPVDNTSPAPINPSGPDAIGFNAEVQPQPKITGLGTTSGPTGGGTSVKIEGTDLDGATSVKFGSTPAASFTIDSESQITAVSPSTSSGPVAVSVATVAGTATSGQQFTYQVPVSPPAPANPAPSKPTCTVPKLKGKSLKVARNLIIRADCNVGRVTKKKGAKAATAKVVGQSSKPGTVLPARTAVNVTLGKS